MIWIDQCGLRQVPEEYYNPHLSLRRAPVQRNSRMQQLEGLDKEGGKEREPENPLFDST